jgi:hypothetical protein
MHAFDKPAPSYGGSVRVIQLTGYDSPSDSMIELVSAMQAANGFKGSRHLVILSHCALSLCSLIVLLSLCSLTVCCSHCAPLTVLASITVLSLTLSLCSLTELSLTVLY